MSTDNASDRIKTLFAQALELDASERDGFLDAECGERADVRARIEGLLRAHGDATGFLDGRGPKMPLGETAGNVIGRYKLLQAIGEGGFGSVWMAEQLEPVRRKVALKIIKLGMDSKQVVARFEAERQALARMDHPNIAKVLDGGVTDNGRPFFVMELVRGVPITEYCDAAKLPARERLELFTLVCHAVQHAHQKGIIHRDIKPSNVLVTLHDGRPVPMVIDFGIAKATSGSLTEKTLFTEFRQFLGTPEYMSPEQAEISGLDVDTRADIYSLGVLLYELLTGTTPLDPGTLRSAAYDEILRMIREVEPQRPSTRVSTLGERRLVVASARATEPNGLQRLMRGDLDWIVMKALEKERTRRYESATSFADDVQRYLAHEPVVARPPSRVYKLAKFMRRNRVVVGAAALVVFALIAGSAAATIGLVRAERGRKDARAAEGRAELAAQEARAAEARERAERERATDEAAAAASINRFYDVMLLAIDPQRLRQHSAFAPGEGLTLATAPALDRDVSVVEMLRGASLAVDEDFGEKPALAANVRETIGVTLLGLGRFVDAEREFAQAARLLAQRPDASPQDQQRIALLRGSAALEAGDGLAALGFLRPAVEAMRETRGSEEAATLNASALLGRALIEAGDYDGARVVLEDTLEAQRRVIGDEHRDVVYTLYQLGDLYLWQTKPLKAAPYSREAYEIATRTLDPNDIVRVQAEYGFAVVLEFELNYARAEPLLRDVLDKKRRLLGSEHASTATTAYFLARCLDDDADLPEREQLMRESAVILRERASDTLVYSILLRDLAQLEFELGRPEAGVRLAKEYADGVLADGGPTDPRAWEAVSFLRGALHRVGRGEEAEQIAYNEVLELRRHTSNPKAVWTCSALGDLTRFLRDCGRLDEAREAWAGCLDVRRALAERPDARGDAAWNYGNMLLRPWVSGMRDAAGAIESLERALDMGVSANLRLSAWEDLYDAYRFVGRDEDAERAAATLAERLAEQAGLGGTSALVDYARFLLDCPIEGIHDPELARENLQSVVARNRSDAFAWALLADANRELGDFDRAREATAARIEMRARAAAAPNASADAINDYLWALAVAEPAELRSADELPAVVARLEQIGTDSPSTLNTLGIARYRLARYREAAETLEEARRLAELRGTAQNPAYDLVFLAMCRAQLGEPAEARDLLDACAPWLDDPDLDYSGRRELAAFYAEAERLLETPSE